MRYSMILGLCIVAAACENTGSRATAPSPSAITATQAQRTPRPIEVTFTKWVTTFPDMAGFTGGDVDGMFEGEVLQRTPFDNGVIVQLNARYHVIDPTGLRSFTAIIEGTQNSQTRSAVLNGVVTEGWLAGSQVHVDFDIITPCEFGSRNTCFRGTIRVMPGSAD
jgi:hypothetical protein